MHLSQSASLSMKALMRFGRVVAMLAIGLLVSGFAGAAPRPQEDAGTRVANAPPPSSDPIGSAVPRFDSPEDAIQAASVASPYRISEQAAMGKIRYRIAMRSGGAWPWPETGEQHVAHDGDTVVLTVCRFCGQEAPPTLAELQRDLQPNRWADNGDSTIRMFASDAGMGTVDRRMRKLVRAVQLRMNGPIDFSQYLTSREAYETRRGDCTESAVLLAAGAKARHIPVRVVLGMAYASRFLGKKRVFGPHMWVQAWDGRHWTSYDAGLGEFDSTHIALALGDGSPDGLGAAFARLKDVQIVSGEGVLPALAAGH
jgi:hypothetical protein